MMQQHGMVEISEVRAVIAQVVDGQPVPHNIAEAVRRTVHAMLQEAAGYGLTPADVVNAILHPVFVKKHRRISIPTA